MYKSWYTHGNIFVYGENSLCYAREASHLFFSPSRVDKKVWERLVKVTEWKPGEEVSSSQYFGFSCRMQSPFHCGCLKKWCRIKDEIRDIFGEPKGSWSQYLWCLSVLQQWGQFPCCAISSLPSQVPQGPHKPLTAPTAGFPPPLQDLGLAPPAHPSPSSPTPARFLGCLWDMLKEQTRLENT